MADSSVALYARVSSESQARDNTIASQIAALRERIAADGWQLEPDHTYVDEGYSGAILLRPALEQLRDAVAAGCVERIYVHAPDRLARRYAHQVLLIEEFHRVGAMVVFLNRPIGSTAEDDLLLQVQGMIAEYERAKIMERSRRGRRHAARSGLVSAFTAAPFGYRYVCRDHGGGVARFEVVEEEARTVRLIFAWVGLERLSLREVCRRLQQAGCPTRHGSARWYASTVRGMLANPAYMGRAVFGRSRFLPARPRLRPIRGHPRPSPRPTLRVPVPPDEWIEVPVPALVEPALFEAARSQLDENRRRKRERQLGPRWLLQGLTVCRRCGYAYYGKTAPRCGKDRSKGELRYYRCIGTDGHRFGGTAVCDNRQVRGDRLEESVWSQVRALLEDPERVTQEYRRRTSEARDGAAAPEEIARLDRQIATLKRGIGRLIDSYAEGVIDKTEFEPRIAGMKTRLAKLTQQHQAALEAAEAERNLSLVTGRLEDFAAKVRQGLDSLDWLGRREILRALIRRIEVDHDSVEVIFRVPPTPTSVSPHSCRAADAQASWQHCTSGGRTHHSLAEPLPSTGQGLGEPQLQGARLPPPCLDPPHAAKALQSRMMFPDRLLVRCVC
jgi:site-specific DNA recombinase